MKRKAAALLLATLGWGGAAAAADDPSATVAVPAANAINAGPAPCTAASDACFFALQLPGGALHFYASLDPAAVAGAAPTRALLAIHGHSHDANKTFDAALQAVHGAASGAEVGRAVGVASNAVGSTLVVAPLFQADAARAAGCSTRGVPTAAAGDLVWTCSSWQEGAAARHGGIGAFAALDALVAHLLQRWPSLRLVSIAGFSAGGQMVQRYAAFAAPLGAGTVAGAGAGHGGNVAVRYVVADPGSWLYFDDVRPFVPDGDCPQVNQWKYGTDGLPATLGRTAAQARAAYAAADISYLQGALDNSSGPGTAARVLDTSCAAMAQGPFRLQRGLAYADYDRRLLAPHKNRQVVVVPGCAHDVACVFPAPSARAALLGTP